MRKFTSGQGAVFAKIRGDRLLKYEKERDRLIVASRKAHGIDVVTLKEACDAGARILELREQGNDGQLRVFEISFDRLFKYGREVHLAGRARWTVQLAACDLISGTDEPWRIADRMKLLRDEAETGQTRLFEEGSP